MDWALVNAHGLLLRVTDVQNQVFYLGLDSLIRSATEDFKAVWKNS